MPVCCQCIGHSERHCAWQPHGPMASWERAAGWGRGGGGLHQGNEPHCPKHQNSGTAGKFSWAQAERQHHHDIQHRWGLETPPPQPSGIVGPAIGSWTLLSCHARMARGCWETREIQRGRALRQAGRAALFVSRRSSAPPPLTGLPELPDHYPLATQKLSPLCHSNFHSLCSLRSLDGPPTLSFAAQSGADSRKCLLRGPIDQ